MDININNIKTLPSPQDLINENQLDESDNLFIEESRNIIKNILSGNNSKLLVIIGPCSIHDINSAIKYGNYVKEFQKN
jgi:3-deoxy-7-phosphoheptulonate synthase